jgi:hypothetical protein
VEPQYIGTSSATDNPPNFYYGDVSASLLWQCLDNDRDAPITTAAELGACCQMDASCQATLVAATQCQTQQCLDPDLKAFTKQYFNCVSTGGCVNPSSGNDHGAFCLQLTFGSTAAPDGSSGLEAVFDTLQATQQCSAVDPFIASTCDVAANCCPKCSHHMGAILDTVLNSVVLNNNLRSDANAVELQCPIDHNVCCPNGVCPTTAINRSDGGRALRSLQSDQDAQSEEIDAIADRCTRGLSRNLIAYNKTFAGRRFIRCLEHNLAKLLLEEEAGKNATSSAEADGSVPSSAMTRMALTAVFSVLAPAVMFLLLGDN